MALACLVALPAYTALALEKHKRGGNVHMPDESKRHQSKSKDASDKNLRAEIEQLRMENAYLKKLYALVQERVQQVNVKK